jgi:hypothetical protein
MRPISGSGEGYRTVLADDESLKVFLQAMADFDVAFCKAMNDNTDYTLRLEVRGDQGKLLHVRVNLDGFARPKGVTKKYVGAKSGTFHRDD